MRMWMVEPEIMCRHHLLGEHRELHTLAGALWSPDIDVDGWVERGFVDPSRVVKRHAELVAEFARRDWPSGLDHASPLPPVDGAGAPEPPEPIDQKANTHELLERCDACWDRFVDAMERRAGSFGRTAHRPEA